jgi:hypothetical protein
MCFAKRGQRFHLQSLGTGEHPASQEPGKRFDEKLLAAGAEWLVLFCAYCLCHNSI